MDADVTLFQYAIDNAKEQKGELVARCGVGSDLEPMLALHHDTALLGVVHLPKDLKPKLSAITKAVAHSEANIVVVIDEGFSWIKGSVFEKLMHREFGRHGDLARRFAEGDPQVVESLQVCVFTTDHTRFHMAPYRYAGRSVVWQTEEALTFDDLTENRVVDGNVHDAVHEGFGLRATTKPATTPLEFATATGLSIGAPLGPRPPRNTPCPCGSGRKSKVCCFR